MSDTTTNEGFAKMHNGTADESHSIWYDRPAETWIEALPIGSGKLGAMCFGGVAHERIQLNDTTGWSGGPSTELSGNLPSAEVCQAAIDESRRAVEAGDWEAADAALMKIQHGYPQSFLPFADLAISIGQAVADPDSVSGYRRTLDLSRAEHTVEFTLGGAEVRMSTRASNPHGVLLIVIEADGGAGLDIDVALQTQLRVIGNRSSSHGVDVLVRFPDDVASNKSDVSEPIRYGDGDQSALDGAVSLRWTHDGEVEQSLENGISAHGVHRAELYVTTQTTFVGLGEPLSGTAETSLDEAVRRIAAAVEVGAEAVAVAQVADHGALYERCTLDTSGSPQSSLPTGDRLLRAFDSKTGALAADPGLAGLLFNFGRYLLICSSREGGLPANLQGIWNDQMQPPWSSDYTTNINLEMNYWLAEQTDLAECIPPLFDYIEALAVSGTETAERVFGAPGWVAFHCSDGWAYSQSVGDGTHDPSWAFWPMAGPWLLQHLRERLLFGGSDETAERAWPLVRSAAEFYLHFVVENGDGTLGTNPSTSPENHFTAPGGVRGAAAASSTMDISLVTDLFRFVVELGDRLGIAEDSIVRSSAAALPRLPQPHIGPDGMIAEWPDDRLRPDPDHRHTAHLYFVHPSDAPITPELAQAASSSLEGRGDESTGWSLAWKMAMRARLKQPEKAGDLVRLLFRDATIYRGPYVGGLYSNLFAAHPPFQIDANFGYVAAVAECLLQSHRGEIDLLPAVPGEFGSGRVCGLIARPGVAIDLEWRDRALVSATLIARDSAAGMQRVAYNGAAITIDLIPGVPVTMTPADFALQELNA